MSSTPLFPVSAQPFALSPRQQRIYEGLSAIREDIGQFYWDAVEVMHYPMLSKTHLIAHLCREIDGGLRDVLELEQDKKRYEKEHKEELLQVAEEALIYDAKGKPATGNIASVIVSGGETVPKELIAEWARISNSLARFAHRDSNNQQPRDISDFQELWQSYERVLDHLVGTYYKRLDRIDRLLMYDTPPAYALASLRHQSEDQGVSRYFFTKLDKPGWLEPLQQAGFFERDSIPDWQKVGQGHYIPPGWPQIFYLKRMALKFPSTHPRLREIVGKLIENGPLRGEMYYYDYVNTYLPEIMVTISGEEFSEEYTEFICGLILSDKTWVVSDILKNVLFHLFIKNNYITQFEKVTETILSPIELNASRAGIPMGNHTLRCIEDHLEAIAGWEAEIFLHIIDQVVRLNKDPKLEWGFMLRSHLMEDKTELYDDPGKLLGYLGAKMLSLCPVAIAEIWTSRWLYTDTAILKAAALYSIEHHYNHLGHLFWAYPQNPLSSLPRQEIYSLLHTCYPAFSEGQWQQILAWIEALEQGEWEENPQFVAYHRKEWLLAVLPSGRTDVTDAFERYNQIAQQPIENPGFNNSARMRPVPVISPISIEDFLLKSNTSVAGEILAFEGPDSSWDDEPDRRGLIETFRNAFRQQPEKFLADLMPFVSLPADMQIVLIWDINGHWRDGKPGSHLTETLEFLAIVAAQATTGHKDEAQVWARTAGFICGRLEVKDGVVIEDLPIIQNILLSLSSQSASYRRKPIEARFDINDLFNEAPPLILRALILYTLRRAELLKLPEGERWEPEIREATIKYVLSGEGNLDLYGTIGWMLPQMMYLDGASTHILDLVLPEQTLLRLAMLKGYLFTIKSVHEPVYLLFKVHGIFPWALTLLHEEYQTHASERYLDKLIQYCCVTYWVDWESLDDSKNLLWEILQRRNSVLTTILVKAFVEEKEYNPRVFAYVAEWVDWKAAEWQQCRQNMLVWALCGDKITTQTVEWVSRAASSEPFPYNDLQETAIERLLHHVERYPALSGEILLMLIATLPKGRSYGMGRKEKELITIVKKLFLHKQTDLAVEICSAIGKLGYDFLREVETTFRPIADRTPEEWYDEVFTYFPDAVLCGYTAWYYHGFSTFSPWEYYLVTHITEKPELPDHLKIVCWEYPMYLSRIGIEEVTRPNGQKVRITDPERSVCDLILFENQVDAEVFREVLNTYFQGRKSNITRLLEYASALGIEDRLRTFMKVLI